MPIVVRLCETREAVVVNYRVVGVVCKGRTEEELVGWLGEIRCCSVQLLLLVSDGGGRQCQLRERRANVGVLSEGQVSGREGLSRKCVRMFFFGCQLVLGWKRAGDATKVPGVVSNAPNGRGCG